LWEHSKKFVSKCKHTPDCKMPVVKLGTAWQLPNDSDFYYAWDKLRIKNRADPVTGRGPLDRLFKEMGDEGVKKLAVLQWHIGFRVYACTGTRHLFQWIRSLKTSERTAYEVCGGFEGSQFAHFVIDLDLKRRYAGDMHTRKGTPEGLSMFERDCIVTDGILSVVLEALDTIEEVSLEHSTMLEIDASSRDKFSRHLVFHLRNSQGALLPFESIEEQKGFIIESVLPKFLTCSECETPYETLCCTNTECSLNENREVTPWGVFVDANGVLDLVLDRSIYTFRRLFRFLLCTKYEDRIARTRVLRIVYRSMPDETEALETPLCRCLCDASSQSRIKPTKEQEENVSYEEFAATLVTYLEPLSRVAGQLVWHPPGGHSSWRSLPFSSSKSNTGSTTISSARRIGMSARPTMREKPQSVKIVWNWIKTNLDPMLNHKWRCSEGDAGVVFLETASKQCKLAGMEHNSNHIRWMVNMADGYCKQGCYSEKRECCEGWGDTVSLPPTEAQQAFSFLQQEDTAYGSDDEDNFINVDEDGQVFWGFGSESKEILPSRQFVGNDLLVIMGIGYEDAADDEGGASGMNNSMEISNESVE